MVRRAVGVDADLVAELAAQQFVDRHAQRLALDVPQGLLDRADRGEDHASTALRPERMVVHLGPNLLDSEGISTHQHRFNQVLHHRGGAGAANSISNGRFADAGQALIGDEFEEDRMEAADLDEVNSGCRNFHGL